MDIRRVVTGNTPAGAAVVLDEAVAPITLGVMPGTEFHQIWGSDTPAMLPTDGTKSDLTPVFPPAGGYRFGIMTLGPASVALPADFDLVAGIDELRHKLPGMLEVLEPTSPGMHTTDTIDYVVVLSGEVSLELDNEEQVALRAGDTIVQNGTRHAWRNLSDRPCVMATAIIGATRQL